MDGPAASTTLPPPAHLLALISMIPTLSRPTVIILDAFDFFALHARQSLLYCLFDTVQHSKGGLKGKGMSVVGVTTRVDTVNLLEKRVKSRFSGRIFRTSSPSGLDLWMHLARTGLCASIGFDHSEEWAQTWKSSVDDFLQDPKVFSSLSETFSLSRDVRLLSRILVRIWDFYFVFLRAQSGCLDGSHCGTDPIFAIPFVDQATIRHQHAAVSPSLSLSKWCVSSPTHLWVII